MIHVQYEKENNYPHDKEIILFDRNAFQSLREDELLKVNEKFNVLCPQIFVMECIAPNNTDKKPREKHEKDKESLLEKLELIENPVVLAGKTNIARSIAVVPNPFYDPSFDTILTSEEIVKSCITSTPMTMKRVTPEELLAHYRSRIKNFKAEVKNLAETCEGHRGTLTTNRLISEHQKQHRRITDNTLTKQEAKRAIRSNERTYVTQELDYAVKEAQLEIVNKSIDENIGPFGAFCFLTPREKRKLRSRIQDGKLLTVENYPDLAYPIYIYYLALFTVCSVQHDTKHLDKSYVRDIRYLHYLNFCDIFVADESSTPHIVKSMPYSNIKTTPVITSEKLKKRLN